MGFALTVTTLYKRRPWWKAHFRPLQRQTDFQPEIRIAWLPNQTPDKLKGWQSLEEDPFKIQVLTAEQFSRNAAFQVTSICS